jgi:hypothetical protein
MASIVSVASFCRFRTAINVLSCNRDPSAKKKGGCRKAAPF